MIGGPVCYTPPELHRHLPAKVAGLITGGGTHGVEGETGPRYSLVIFPPNAPFEHVDVTTHGFGPGQFHYAGEEPARKRKPAAPKEPEQQPPGLATAAGGGAGGGAAPAGDPPPPPAEEVDPPPAEDPPPAA